MKHYLLFLVILLFAGFTAMSQQTITGKVTNAETGDPIPGVSVVVKQQTTVGTSTNMDGEYSLQVPENAQSLVFSFVGMIKQEIPVRGRTVIDVELEPAVEEMEEVVVTALGVSRERKSLGYTVQDVSGDEIEQTANPNIETGISGKIAGVEVRQSSGMPGAPSQIFIRGASSFSGDNTPLYVVDGMPIASQNDYDSNVTGSAYSNRAIDIDPNEIESINVLKGQAAAALYGMRASNGVIVITTKKGAQGKLGDPVVQIRSNYTINNVSLLPDVQQTYAQGSGGSFAPANSYSWGPKIEDLPDDPTYGGNNYSGHAGEFFDPYKNAWVNPKAYNNPENFYDRNGYTWNNSVSISNNTEIGNYSLSLSNTDETGIVKNTGMQRYTAKAAGQFNLAQNWRLNFSTNYARNDIQKIPSGNDSWLFTVYGAPASFDLKGTPYNQEGSLGDYRQISYRRGGVGNNPYWAIENNHYYESTNRFFGNANIEFDAFEWATIKGQIGLDSYTTDFEDYTEMGFGDLPAASEYPTPDDPNYSFVQPTGGVIDNYGVKRNIVNALLSANLQHSFSDDFRGTLLMGGEFYDNASEYYTSYGSNFSTPGWNDLDNTSVQNSEYNHYQRRTVGFFGELSMQYMDMLFLTGTGRYDIISSMPRDNRGFFYPSVSLGFIFTELGALKDQNILSFGKLRASYAEVGQAADTYRPEPIFVTGGGGSGYLSYGMEYPVNDITGYKLSSIIYDPQLTPQNTRTIEFGADLRFFDNRLRIDYSYFDQTAEDQIFGVPMAGSTGYATFYTNAGEMYSKGHEIIFNVTPVQLEDFGWDISVNFSSMKNKVVELAEGVEDIFLGGYVTPNIRASAGDAYPAIYGEQYVKDDQGRILVNEDPASPGYGLPMIGEFGLIGEVTPDFTTGITNTFRLFSNLTLSAQIDWKQGGEMYSGSNRLMNLYGSSAETEDRDTPFIYDGYKANGSPNDIERGGADDQGAYQYLYSNLLGSLPESNIYETSFIKLRNVSVSYNIPQKFIAPLALEKARIGFVMRNLLLWSTLDNFDPETSQGQGNMQGGMDYMSLPQTTAYGFNVNLTF